MQLTGPPVPPMQGKNLAPWLQFCCSNCPPVQMTSESINEISVNVYAFGMLDGTTLFFLCCIKKQFFILHVRKQKHFDNAYCYPSIAHWWYEWKYVLSQKSPRAATSPVCTLWLAWASVSAAALSFSFRLGSFSEITTILIKTGTKTQNARGTKLYRR